MASETVEIPVIWLAAQSCSGCSVSLLNAAAPEVGTFLLEPFVPGRQLNLLFHMTIMAGQGEPVVQILEDTARDRRDGYVFVAEGSFPTKDKGLASTLGERNGAPVSMTDRAAELAAGAMTVIGIGACASFGGIPAAAPDVTGARSIGQVMKDRKIDKPLVNVPGCPPHPDWFTGTVAGILLRGLPRPGDLDELGRPRAYFGKLIHESCPRRPDFDAAKFAKAFGEDGCLFQLGCKGPYTWADCPTRMWNHGVNWCIGAGGPCAGCVEPEFPDAFSPLYKKLTEERLDRFAIRT
jgi:hydrogenase small subunit